jgi:hypothetical protein
MIPVVLHKKFGFHDERAWRISVSAASRNLGSEIWIPFFFGFLDVFSGWIGWLGKCATRTHSSIPKGLHHFSPAWPDSERA